MLIKFLLGIAVVGFSAFCGYLLAKKYRQRKAFFMQFKDFNLRFLNEISYYRRPLAAFASETAYQGEFQEMISQFFQTIPERSAGERMFLDETQFAFLSQEERSFSENYFQMLGRGDSFSQKNYFSSVKEVLQKKQTETENECKKYGDLYVKIGFLCGLLILILIL